MDKIKIRGGKKLEGKIFISGAKNAIDLRQPADKGHRNADQYAPAGRY